jgi:uncharacterized protein (DUF608 family)
MDSISRRNLLKGSAAVVSTVATTSFSSASSTTGEQQDNFSLPSYTLRGLLARGVRETVTGNDLSYIGMPVGGFFAGTVYLGGDGQLWNWDIFNQELEGALSRPAVVFMGDSVPVRNGANYVRPLHQVSTFDQRFEIFVGEQIADKESSEWSGSVGEAVKFGKTTFRGEYPIGKVQHREANAPIEVDVEAFSPFVPLKIEDSSYPATTLTYRIRNVGKHASRVAVKYQFDNPVLNFSRKLRGDFEWVSKESVHSGKLSGVEVGAKGRSIGKKPQPDIVVMDWESGTYGEWKVEGTAFGSSPRKVSELPRYMGDVNADATYVVNSHQTRNGEDVGAGDAHRGKLTSIEFELMRDYLNVRIGGGNHSGLTCLNLIVDGRVVASLTGNANNRMDWKSISTSKWKGKNATIEIVDNYTGAWGNISVGEIIQSDTTKEATALETLADFGSFAVQASGEVRVSKQGERYSVQSEIFLAPGEEKEITFFISWYFPNIPRSVPGKAHWYSKRWNSAENVINDLRKEWTRLREATRVWNKTWYDSSLPFWFLDRTFLNLSTLATKTCFRTETGRFYFTEGIGCCEGTCTHVWGYAQAIGRIFPEVEKRLREEVDYGLAFRPDTGAIDYRAEYGQHVAHDGQASCVLRFYREHLMSRDNLFLEKNWTKVKKSIEYLISEDKDQDGLLEGSQYNTLDAAWYGPMGWISSLYVASLRAGEKMAELVGDVAFASKCKALADSGSQKLVTDLFNGEYFIHKADPKHPEANSTNDGCHIDQMYGQFWASQIGLPRIVPASQGISSMKNLYKYNFYEDIWQYRKNVKAIRGGRWYATPGEPGLIMCTFPKGGSDRATGKGSSAWAAGYFNECMTGFEYQAAANMISEGLVKEGLKVVRAIHERYSPSLRNPYNEVECSDHYGRAMASFGAYVSLTGMHIDSPKNVVALNPKTPQGKVRCAFVDAFGWGTIDNSSGKAVRTYVFKL